MNEEKDRIFIEWEKRFELGIPIIDKQHEHLVEVCNHLYTALMNSHKTGQMNWQEAFSASLLESFKYVQEHFAYEEKYLSLVAFPNYTAHKKLHAEFIKKILATVTTFSDVTFQAALGYVRYLGDWILEHIAIEDRKYVPYVLQYMQNQKQN